MQVNNMLYKFCIGVLTIVASAVLLYKTKWWKVGAHAQCMASGVRQSSPCLNLLDITNYVQLLDRPQIYHLGVVLGLSQQTVKATEASGMDTKLFLDDVIVSWLRRENEVEKRGIPSWETLVKALRHPRLRQNGIANDIERQQIFRSELF